MSERTGLTQLNDKIIYYSRGIDESKFLRYLILTRTYCAKVGHRQRSESTLRRKGAFQAICTALVNGFNDKERSSTQRNILLNGLILISNIFAVDSKSRTEGKPFILTLFKPLLFIQDREVLPKVVKCIANLSKDVEGRKYALESGIGSRILALLEEIKIDPESQQLDKDDEILFASISRAIRILISDQDLSNNALLLRNSSFNGIGRIFKANLEKPLVFETLRTLSVLTEKLRVFPSNLVRILLNGVVEVDEEGEETATSGPGVLVKIVQILEDEEERKDEKRLQLLIDILQNLARSREISQQLGILNIFSILLSTLSSTQDSITQEKILTLILTLINYLSENRYKLSVCKLDILLDFLKSDVSKRLHFKVLSIFEHVYETAFIPLISSSGFIELLHGILAKEFGDIEHDTLRKRIGALNELKSICPVHNEVCPFKPKYRCNSPSYLQIQEEMKGYGRDGFDSGGEESEGFNFKRYNPASPSSSSSGYASCSSPASGYSGYYYSPSSSPRSTTSPPTSPIIDDFPEDQESSQIQPNDIEKLEEEDPKEEQDEGIPPDITDNHSPPLKRAKIDLEDTVLKEEVNENAENESKEPTTEPVEDCNNEGNAIPGRSKSSAMRIVSVLNILSRCIYIKPFPNITKFTPILLSILLNGKVNSAMSPSKPNPNDELNKLGIQAFFHAFRILKLFTLQIEYFEYFIENDVIPDLFRIFYPFDEAEDEIFRKNGKVLFSNLRGESNDTAGWREGYLSRALLISDRVKSEKISLLIPIFYFEKDTPSYRKYLHGSMEKIFEILEIADEIHFNKFQDCIIALSSLAQTLGINWGQFETLRSEDNSGPATEEVTTIDQEEDRVTIVLDDGTETDVSKSQLTKSSPVFMAMFEGQFLEAAKRKVKFRNICKESLDLLISYIKSPNGLPTHDINVLFELLEISDQFFLEGLQKQAMKTLLQQICPNSSPLIYEMAVKDGGRIIKTFPQASQFHLTFILLQYLLVGKGVSLTSRCTGFYKIFANVENSIVIGDLRAIFEYYLSRSKP